jgi:prepilin-type N-terminal cleavage/methylation domain-containing protein
MKNKQRTTNNEQRTHKAFTLIELVVSIALLAIVFFFAGAIFKVSIKAYRTAGANAEIMQKLRAITDQLNADFKGIRTDAPLLIWFEQDDPNRYDQIMFFANGDFQSIQLYESGSNAEPDPEGSELVIGTVARIFYGQAQSRDKDGDMQSDPANLSEEDRLLARRQHILTADPCLVEWPHDNMLDFDDKTLDGYKNELYEHDSLSLAQWKIIEGSVYEDRIIPTCFEFRPLVDMSDPNTFHKLMCEGVGSFAIQWAYWDSVDGRFYWYPSRDPDGDDDVDDSHFTLINEDEFGVYFNAQGSIANPDWYPISDFTIDDFFVSFPKAIKFTFRLYDSKGIIKEDDRAGRTFTHIVYLGN